MAEHTITTTPAAAPASYTGGTPATDPGGVKQYTESQLNAMNKADILALSTQFGYAMTTTESNTKAEIVADFLTQQAAAQTE